MGIIRNLQLRAYQKPVREPKLTVSPVVGSQWTSQYTGLWEERPYYQLVDANRGWVYTAIDKIAKSVAMIPLKLFVYRNSTGEKVSCRPSFKAEIKTFKNVGAKVQFLKAQNLTEEPIDDHPFLDLMKSPNTYFTRFDLWYHTFLRLELGGQCGWMMFRDKIDVPRRIHTLPLTKFARLRTKVTNYADVEYYHYEDGEIFMNIEPRDMIMFRYAHAASPWQGYGPLQSQTFAYDLDLFLSEQQRAFFRNNAMLGTILSTDQNLVSDQISDLQMQIESKYVGAMKSGTPMVLHSGLKPYRGSSASGRDTSIRDVGDYAREKLLTSFDLSDGAVGLVHDVNRANMEGLREAFVNDCLKPKCMLVEEGLEKDMLPQYEPSGALTLEFDLPFPSNDDYRLKERMGNLKMGYTCINEERAKDGLDEKEWGDKPWMPTNTQQYGAEPKPALPEPKPPVGAREESPVGTQTEEEEGEAGKGQGYHSHSHRTLPRLDEHRKAILNRLVEKGKIISGRYSGWSRKKVEADLTQSRVVDYIVDGG